MPAEDTGAIVGSTRQLIVRPHLAMEGLAAKQGRGTGPDLHVPELAPRFEPGTCCTRQPPSAHRVLARAVLAAQVGGAVRLMWLFGDDLVGAVDVGANQVRPM
jgi:hypothetical protein